MAKLALITGASSGIGEALARYHAKKGGDVIITARREDQLNALKSQLEEAHGVTVHVFAGDLGSPDGARDLFNRVDGAGLEIDFLINNAGFGGHGAHIDRDLEDEMAMIDLNVKSLVALCHLFGKGMAARGRGRILNVGSSAGFMPGPTQAVYFATKAFVTSFSQALDHELRPSGVTVTVLAPGYVETEFADRADLHGTQMVKQGGKTPDDVARIGYEAMRAGELVTFDRASISTFVRFVMPFVPKRMVMTMMQKMQAK